VEELLSYRTYAVPGEELIMQQAENDRLPKALREPIEEFEKVLAGKLPRHSPDRPAYLPAILARSGVDRKYFDYYYRPNPPKLPDGAAEYLQPSSPRLIELKKQYAELNGEVVRHFYWTPEYVSSQIPLTGFRGDPGFLWQHRDYNLPVSYLLTYYYLQAQGKAALLRRLSEDDLFGIYSVTVSDDFLSDEFITRDRLDSASEISFLDSVLEMPSRPQCRFLDIGSGYGRLAHRLVQAFDNTSVCCVDAIAEASFLCEYYLRFRGVDARAEMIPLPEIESRFKDLNIDVAINVHSFSECSVSAVQWWIDLLRKHEVRYLMIVPNPNTYDRIHIYVRDSESKPRDLVTLLKDRGYRLVAMKPKYQETELQQFGVTPTHYFFFELVPNI
jgi:putative sugar O-methyltransferase